MDKIEAKEFDNYRDRQSESKRPGSDVGLRRSSRTPKVSQEYAGYFSSIRSLQRGSIPVDDHHFNDDERISLSAHSSISMSRSSKSRRSVGSSVSSKARVAARSAELAKLELEQAERRAKTKQKQMQEQIEQELQDLRDQAEYSQLEAHLLAADQAGDSFSDRSSKRSWPKFRLRTRPI